MNTSWVARNWAIAITMSLMVGCGPEEFDKKQTQEPVQSGFSEQEIIGNAEVQLPSSVNTGASPAIMALGGVTYVFYRGAGADCGIWMLRTSGPIENQQWEGPTRLPDSINTSSGPSVVTLNNNIYVVYKGAWDDTHIYVARTPDGGVNWGMARFPDNVRTTVDPSAIVSGNSLYVLYAGIPSIISMAQLSDNTTWTGGGISTNTETGFSPALSASSAPSIVTLGGETYGFYNLANVIYMAHASGPIENRQWQGTPLSLPGGVNTSAAASAVTLNNNIYVVYKGVEIHTGEGSSRYDFSDTHIYVARTTDRGSTWNMARFPDTVNTTNRPTGFVSGNSLYVLYRGVYNDSRMFMVRLSDNPVWEPLPY